MHTSTVDADQRSMYHPRAPQATTWRSSVLPKPTFSHSQEGVDDIARTQASGSAKRMDSPESVFKQDVAAEGLIGGRGERGES